MNLTKQALQVFRRMTPPQRLIRITLNTAIGNTITFGCQAPPSWGRAIAPEQAARPKRFPDFGIRIMLRGAQDIIIGYALEVNWRRMYPFFIIQLTECTPGMRQTDTSIWGYVPLCT